MPSITKILTPLSLLLLVSSRPADTRRSRAGCVAKAQSGTSASDADLAAAPTSSAVSSSSSDMTSTSTASASTSTITEASTANLAAINVGADASLSLGPVNEAFGISICIGGICEHTSISTPTTIVLPSTTVAITSIPTIPTTTVITGPASSGVSTSAPSPSTSVAPPPSSGGNDTKMVFAHFMIGIVSTYALEDHVRDQTLAKSKGIDGFALNIGVDPYTQNQLDLAYQAAQQVGFKCFISFDFNWYGTGDTASVASMLSRYVSNPAQLQVDGKAFVSSFVGDGFDWGAAATQVGKPIYAVPYFQPSQQTAGDAGISGLFSWDAWPGQLNNVPVDQNMTTSQDENYLGVLNPDGKKYMAPVSPWFFTHYGPEVSYSKNWLFYSEMLWKTRWDQILSLGSQGVDFVEIVTWNDYGESHYVGPFDTPHTDDGASKWASGLDHTAMLDLAVPYIQAFKAGISAPVITQEYLVYWHRPHLKDASCDSTDNCGAKPTGWDFVDDSVFVATMTQNGGMVTVTSGDGKPFTKQVDGGIQIFEAPMSAGKQSFSMKTSAGATMQGASNLTVTDTCWNGIYNFNFHAGTVSQ